MAERFCVMLSVGDDGVRRKILGIDWSKF